MEAGDAHSHALPHVTNLYINTLPPSASENNSAILPSDAANEHSGTEMRLDSVSAIITARQMSSRGNKGVTFDDGGDHVALVMDDEDDPVDHSSFRGRAHEACCSPLDNSSTSSSHVIVDLYSDSEDSSRQPIDPNEDHKSFVSDCQNVAAALGIADVENCIAGSDHLSKSCAGLRTAGEVRDEIEGPKERIRSESFPKLKS